MLVDYISDLHMDFHAEYHLSTEKWETRTRQYISNLIEPSKRGEVLVLAGDYSHFNLQTFWIFDEFSKHYQQVYGVIGNHDLYLISNNQRAKYKHSSVNRIIELKKMLSEIPNVHLFTGSETKTYDGITFAGNPMWYPLETYRQKQFFYNNSNDSRLIYGIDMKTLHFDSMMLYEDILIKDVDVMISHTPVIYIDSHHKYGGTECYFTPVDKINVKHWVMAHSHERKVYKKGGINFYMNCLGYPHDQLGEPNIKSFEVIK